MYHTGVQSQKTVAIRAAVHACGREVTTNGAPVGVKLQRTALLWE